MKRILYFYAASGFVSLGYQVAWFRIVTDWHGSTNFTFALVVSNFIGGLAVGSLASRRVTGWIGRRLQGADGLRVYGAVELLVALAILLTGAVGLLPPDLFGSFPYALRDGIWEHRLGYQVAQSLVAAVCVFVPCFFMGVTFPLLCDVFRASPGGDRFPARLYAWNTLGACTGVLACQFVLLPRVGHGATLWSMAVANAALGALFLTGRAGVAPEGAGGVAREATAPAAVASDADASPGALLALATLSGFASGALEGDLFKRITFVIELNPGATMTLISFWAIVGIFLASLAVGRLPRLGFGTIKVAYALAAAYAFAVWQVVDPLRDLVEQTVLPVPVEAATSLEGFSNLQFPSGLTQLFVFVGVLTFPPYFLVSLLLPRVCNTLQAQGRHLGVAYGLNTAAFCTGLLLFVLIAPMASIFYSLKLFLVTLALCAAWLWILRETRPLAAWKPAALVAALAIAAWRAPADFDPSFFPEGSPPREFPVRAVKSNGAHTTFVVDVPGSPRLFFGRLQMSSTNLRAQTYMRLMAHVPLVLQEDPKRALLICFGVGNTASAIASHPGVEAIDVVDLDEKVFETAPEFASVNGEVHLDPRVRLVHDDGRSFLARTHERYDLITSEPPPPLAAGVYRLYSREYYETALAHLTPTGVMSQWLPVFLMTPESVEMAISTFVSVFPHAFLFVGYGTDFILVGSRVPPDPAILARRMAEPGVVASDLARLSVRSPAGLFARIVQGDGELRERYGSARRISDLRNDLEHGFLDPRDKPVIPLVPDAVVRYVEALHGGTPRPEIAALLRHLGRLRFHVQGYPFETLATVDPDAAPGVALADVDWLALGELSLANQRALRRRDLRESTRILEAFLEASREQPEVLLLLASRELSNGRAPEAVSLLEELLAIEPGDPLALSTLALAHARGGDAVAALDAWERVLRDDPGSVRALERMAWIHATHADPAVRDGARAVALAERAAGLAGVYDARVRETLAAALAAEGRFAEATAVLQRLLDEAPRDGATERRRYLRQLSLYRRGEALSEGRPGARGGGG